MTANVPTIIDVTEQDRDWWDAEPLRYSDGEPVLTEEQVNEVLGDPGDKVG